MIYWLGVFVLMLSPPQGARVKEAPSGDRLIRASLIADTIAVEPGRPFRVGVRMQIEPGWHTYWLHPGESGQPPQVNWKLPPGFAAGELEFPIPIRFDLPGGIVNIGYRDEAVLVCTITPPQAITESTVQLSAEMNWLVCDDELCLPGSSVISLQLPVGVVAADHAKEFASWETMLPREPAESIAEVTITNGAGGVDVHLSWKMPVKDVEWFPAPSDDVELKDVSVRTESATTRIQANVRIRGGKSSASLMMPSVVAYRTASGQRTAISLPVRLPAISNDSRN